MEIQTTETPVFQRRHVADLVLMRKKPGKDFKPVRKLASFFETDTNFARAQKRVVRVIERAAQKQNHGKDPSVAILAKGHEKMRAELAILAAGARPLALNKSSGRVSRMRGQRPQGAITSPRPYHTSSRDLSRIAAKLYRKNAQVIYVGSPAELKTALRLAAKPVKVRTASGKQVQIQAPIKKIVSARAMPIPKQYAGLAHLVDMPKTTNRESKIDRQDQALAKKLGIPTAKRVQTDAKIQSKIEALKAKLRHEDPACESDLEQSDDLKQSSFSASLRLLKREGRAEPKQTSSREHSVAIEVAPGAVSSSPMESASEIDLSNESMAASPQLLETSSAPSANEEEMKAKSMLRSVRSSERASRIALREEKRSQIERSTAKRAALAA